MPDKDTAQNEEIKLAERVLTILIILIVTIIVTFYIFKCILSCCFHVKSVSEAEKDLDSPQIKDLEDSQEI